LPASWARLLKLPSCRTTLEQPAPPPALR
jgi:hypothetical protein